MTISVKQKLSDLAADLPPGYRPDMGIRMLVPAGYEMSLKELLRLAHYERDGSWFRVGALSGKGHFVASLNGNYRMDATVVCEPTGPNRQFVFAFSFQDDVRGISVGDAHAGVFHELNLEHSTRKFDVSGMSEWIKANWPKAFKQDVSFQLKEITHWEIIGGVGVILLALVIVPLIVFGGRSSNDDQIVETGPTQEPPPDE